MPERTDPLRYMQIFKTVSGAFAYADGLTSGRGDASIKIVEIREYDNGFGVIVEDNDRHCEVNYVYDVGLKDFPLVRRKGENFPEDEFE